MQVQSFSREDPLEKEMATDSSILGWEIHGRRSLATYSPWGRKGRHDLVTKPPHSNAIFNFLRNCQAFPQWLHYFAFPLAVSKSSRFSTLSSTLVIFYSFGYSHPELILMSMD